MWEKLTFLTLMRANVYCERLKSEAEFKKINVNYE